MKDLPAVSDDVRELNPDLFGIAQAYGLTSKRPPARPRRNLEEQEQIRLFEMLAAYESVHPELVLVYHIPNGGLRSKATAGRMKAAGVKSGVPDIHAPLVRQGYAGLWIEMKAGKNKPTPDQEYWLAALRKEGHKAIVCYGANEALAAILEYIG